MAISLASWSVILPLPSSPHCAPTTTVAGTSAGYLVPCGGSDRREGGAHREVSGVAVDGDGVTLGDVALQDRQRDAVAQLALDDALERTSTEDRVVALLGQQATPALGDVEGDATIGEALAE